jgi:DinB superfamily
MWVTGVNRDRVLRRIDEEWTAFTASYHGLDETALLTPGVTGTWSIRDLIAHVTWWEEEALTHVPQLLEGGRAPRYSVLYGGIDAFNALMTERKSRLSLAQVFEEQAQTHQRLIALVKRVPESALAGDSRVRRRLRLDTYGHYPKHADAIRRWRSAFAAAPADKRSLGR